MQAFLETMCIVGAPSEGIGLYSPKDILQKSSLLSLNRKAPTQSKMTSTIVRMITSIIVFVRFLFICFLLIK